MPSLRPGSYVGHFQILDLLGRGSAGMVYLARDAKLGRNVALKVLAGEPDADPESTARLLREARAAARLSHPGIATIFEAGEAGGLSYVAMEHVPGRTLRSLLQDAARAPLDVLTIAGCARQVAEGLACAHAQGLVHGDIKPENLIVTPEAQVKILDFGLARRYRRSIPGMPAGSRGSSAEPTLPTLSPAPGQEGAGTPAYASPEQIRGEPLDPRSDLFSLGAVMLEMLIGRPPFARATAEATLRAVLQDEPPLAEARARPGAAKLVRVVERALQKDAAARFGSAADLAAALARAASGSGRRPRRAAVLAAVLALAGAGVAFWALAPRSAPGGGAAPGFAGARLRAVRVVPEPDEDPCFSPGGDQIVFSLDGDLAILPADPTASAPEPRRITSGPEVDLEPAWSPDGLTIAFTREQPDGRVEIWKVPAQGGEATRVVLQAANPAWSPSGDRLAFVQRGLGRSTAILTVQPDGRYSRTVTRMEDAYFHSQPAFSPDGGQIVFVKDQGGGSSSEIWLVPAGGGAARPLTRGEDGVFSTEPVFTRDGASLVYASNRGGARNLWVVPIGGGEPVQLTTGPGDDGDPSISPDGRRILYSVSRSSSGLFTFDRQRGQERRLVVDAIGQIWGPAFSPDGLAIAYTRIEDAGRWELDLIDAQGGSPRRLVAGPPSPVWPRWSPDGRFLVYCTYSKSDDDLYVIPREGGEPRRLTSGEGDDWWPTWSPDGQQIVFARTEAETTRLYRVAAAGGRPRRLSEETATLPDYSPDGRWLAIARNRTFRNGVGLMPAQGGPVRWLTDTGGWPVFRPDGRAVGFVRMEPGSSQSLWEVDLDGSEPRRIEVPRFGFWNMPFDYSAAAPMVSYSNSLDFESDLWMLEAAAE